MDNKETMNGSLQAGSTELDNKDTSNLFEEIGKAVKYTFESAIGKFSLEAYLLELSKFTDSEISSAIDQGKTFRGGEVTMTTDQGLPDIDAAVILKFETSDGKWEEERAQRKLEKKYFISEAIKTLEVSKTMRFQIEEP